MFQIQKSYKPKLKKYFNLLSIDGKYQVIGSGVLKAIKYKNDFDLMELFKSSDKDVKDNLYQLFLNKFHEAYKNHNVWITDFKCGEDEKGEPLRWTYDDMKKGTNKGITFQNALLQDAMMKMDLVVIIDGLMTEFSENYYLTLGGKANYKKINTDKLLKQLKDSYKEFYDEGNKFKALKRVFSYKLLKDKNLYRNDLGELIKLFNSKTGYKYKIKSELDTMLLLMDNKFKPVPKEQLEANMRLIMRQLNNKDEININKKNIENIKENINKEVQEETMQFINNNKNILL
jgi:hypothetical protein